MRPTEGGGALASLLVLLLLIAPAPPPAAPPSPPPSPLHLPLRGDPLASQASQAPNYDEQVGLTFTDSFSSMKYNVTAVAQTNSDGYGPAYLLNGLTDKGYWYQVGLSWNWAPGSVPGTGFSMNYEVFDPNGDSIFPPTGGGGLNTFSGPVNQGDEVSLSLNFSNGNVIMEAADLNTGANASMTFSAERGSTFTGLINPANANGFFSGLMTEEYHSAPYYGSQGEVTYRSSVPLSDGFLWADEFGVSPRTSLFYGSKFVSFKNPTMFQSFSLNGTSVNADAYTLITGALSKDLLTISYSVSGGGSGYGDPTLSYTEDGRALTATVTSTPTTFFLDPGTSWSVSPALPGSTQTGRWSTPLAGGTATGGAKENLTYYHQFLHTFYYAVVDGGTGYSAPRVQSTEYGSQASFPVETPVWVDAGAQYSYAEYLPGSSVSERWASVNASGSVVQGAGTNATYYHQFGLTISYAVLGGGSPGSPALSYVQFGLTRSATLTGPSTYFADPGSPWSVPSSLPGSTSEERWTTPQSTGGTALGPLALSLSYQHQFMFTALLSGAGGSVLPPSGWVDSGASVSLGETAAQGWQFRGWNGTGIGSYSGNSSAADATAYSPIQETATFYPGLLISAGDGGEVTYTFAGGQGTLGSGSSSVVYAPQGTRIELTAAPSSLLYAFAGWSAGGNATSQTAVVLGSPATVSARFAVNLALILGLVASAGAAVAAAAWLLRRRRPQN